MVHRAYKTIHIANKLRLLLLLFFSSFRLWSHDNIILFLCFFIYDLRMFRITFFSFFLVPTLFKHFVLASFSYTIAIYYNNNNNFFFL